MAMTNTDAVNIERPVWAAKHVGNVRRINEDRCLVGNWRSRYPLANWRGTARASHAWVVVADGMGGHEAGNVASRIAVETISEFVGAATSEAPIRTMLEAQLRKKRFQGVARTGWCLKQMGDVARVPMLYAPSKKTSLPSVYLGEVVGG